MRLRIPVADHIFADAGFADLDTQLQQLAMNAGSAPERFSRLIRRIRSRTSQETAGRPGRPRCSFHVQNRRIEKRQQELEVIEKMWWRRADSNRGPRDYETLALAS